jgi:hypothetical protein
VAIYVPPSTKRRRLVLLVAAGLLVGLLLGFAVGRTSAPDLHGKVDAVKEQAEGAAVGLQRLPIEYEQALGQTSGESMATISEAVDRATSQLDEALDDAFWLGPGVRMQLEGLLRELDVVITDHGSEAEFEDSLGRLVERIGTLFGVDTPSAS